MTLKEIDELIFQMDYNNALNQLQIYINANPSQFDIAQRRVDKIFKSRNAYSVLANQLLDVMENDPENAEKKLQIIAQLESLEKNPSEEHLAFIRQAKSAAQFTYFRAQFRRILDEGSNHVEKKEYTAAVETIKTGFYMYKDEFYEENPPSVTRPVTEILDNIENLSIQYSTIQDRLESSYKAFLAAVKNGVYNDNVTKTYSAFRREMNILAGIRNDMAKSGWELKSRHDELKRRNPDLTEASFMPFIWHFMLGRTNEIDSGILGAIDAQWNTMMEESKVAIYETIKHNFEGAIQNITEQSLYSETVSFNPRLVSEINNFSTLGKNVNGMYAFIRNQDGSIKENTSPSFVRSMNQASFFVNGIDSSFQLLNTLKAQKLALGKITEPKDYASSLRGTNAYPNQNVALILQFEQDNDSAQKSLSVAWYTSYNADFEKQKLTLDANEDIQNTSGVQINNSLLDWSKISSFYEMINSSISSNALGDASSLWKKIATYYASSGTEIVSSYEDGYNVANALYNGITNETQRELNPNNLAPGKYPREAIETVESIQGNISKDVNLLTAGLTSITNAESYRSLYPDEEKSISDSIAYLSSLRMTGTQLVASAREAITLSSRALNEAELRYNQALRAYRAENFDAARENIQRARERYDESLRYQESASLRKSSDANLVSLGAQINESENKVIVTEVRRLKNQAKTEYYNGNFERAENLLSRAKTRWAVTNVDEDDEITNLLALVGTALSMTSGRVILPTAPLYPEMSQMLSIAHQYFDEGSRIIKTDREKAVQVLTEAKNKLQEIQTVYPLNQEASLLTLKIDQLIDPVSFNEMFKRRLESAQNNYKKPDQQQIAYTDLLDLYEIRPDYPGLKTLIYNVELDIGVRARPIDRTALNRSSTLSRQAQQMVNAAGNNEGKLREALSLVDEAIRLNPNNDSAMLLKDRIQVSIGGKAAVVLSSFDETNYQRAIQELQKNNIIEAYAIVERLLQNPDNRRSAKILDLQKKVKALL